MNEKLKPCPFCGGKNVLSTELQDGLPFIAYCQCGAENEAENWNTRPIEDALRKRIAELEGKNEKAFDLIKALRMYCIQAEWDNPDAENEFNEFDAEVCEWLSEFMERER